MVYGLTAKEYDVYTFYKDKISATGICPSYDEVSANFGFSSRSTVHRYLSQLEDKGYVRRLKSRARAIEVIEHVDKLEEIRKLNKVLSYLISPQTSERRKLKLLTSYYEDIREIVK